MKKLLKCKKCGFSIEYKKELTVSDFKLYLDMAQSFGCEKCTKIIKYILKVNKVFVN